MKRWAFLGIGGLLAVVAGGFLVAASGIIPTRASGGHWRITEWFLRFSMQRSAATHSRGVEVPPLDDEGAILKGALHYEFGCRSCHGTPGVMPARVTQAMLPRPANLAATVRDSSPKKLFYIVKHGVKFTGMPAFPSQERDDEVWAVVAFLRTLPELDETGYRHLIDGKPKLAEPGHTPLGDAFAAVNRSCMRCHGSDGLGRGGGIPRIAGQRADYLHHALEAYAHRKRSSGMMELAAASLDEAMIHQLVAHYAQLPSKPNATVTPADKKIIEQGRLIAHEGIRERRVPACVECHEPGGRRANPAYPSLAGQSAAYLVRQLELFKEGRRGGSRYAHLMRTLSARLEAAEMQAVAQYFESGVAPLSSAPTRQDTASRAAPP